MAQPPFDVDAVREAWDHAADAYAGRQASGRDHYRYQFFGPAQRAVCGDVTGLRVLDVGCGAGYFAREMARGGAEVTAVDVSPRMIEHARRESGGHAVEYLVADAAELASRLAGRSFDLATSCVALQDMPRVERVLSEVHQLLRPGARFVACIMHPCNDMPLRVWERDHLGRKRWLCVDRYFERTVIEYHWRDWGEGFTTAALHATLEDWIGWSLRAGFELRGLHEPRPSEEALRRHPDLEDATRIPYFLILDLRRPASPGS
jgi:ubiquinone/menaquinone biosynthesis C-methylase UbiE